MRSALVAAHLVVLLAALTLHGQAAQNPTTFRAGVQAIEVDVFVTDGRGDPIRDLTRDDFELLEDGKPQRITHVSFTDFAASSRSPRTDGQLAQATEAIEGRTLVMLVVGKPSRDPARLFVQHGLGPGDRMAVNYNLQTLAPKLVFTSSRDEMLERIDLFTLPSAERARVPDALEGNGSQATVAFRAAESVFTQLGAMSGRRKSVIWISPPTPNPSDAMGLTAQRRALRAATRNNVAIYAIDQNQPSTRLSTSLTMGRLESSAAYRAIAEETGGDALSNSNNHAETFRRWQRDSSAYYLLAYEPAVDHTDGKFHEISVKVKRSGVKIRARRGYYAPDRVSRIADDRSDF